MDCKREIKRKKYSTISFFIPSTQFFFSFDSFKTNSFSLDFILLFPKLYKKPWYLGECVSSFFFFFTIYFSFCIIQFTDDILIKWNVEEGLCFDVDAGKKAIFSLTSLVKDFSYILFLVKYLLRIYFLSTLFSLDKTTSFMFSFHFRENLKQTAKKSKH